MEYLKPVMEYYLHDFYFVRILLQRGLSAIYLVAFVSAFNQFHALLGERGLLPVAEFISRTGLRRAPGIFSFYYSDRFFTIISLLGIALSLAAVIGISESGPLWFSVAVWIALWVLYLSIVNVGQIFYSFGWESMLLEAGFFASFLGPISMEPSFIPIYALRWMLFRVEFGAGLIKIRHDKCWRDLTCLFYHYETQPLPNPLSWYFHRIPGFLHKFSVLFSHFVQLVVPLALFAPQPFASVAGGLIIFHQLWLIISGNYSWLNWLTVVLGFSAFSDTTISMLFAIHTFETVPPPMVFVIILYILAGATVLLSIQPTLNLLSRSQLMNYSYNPVHLVNTYGAFGTVTKERYEIVIEGSSEESPENDSDWKAYEFRGKPGNTHRIPPQVAPYHLRLDWMVWFLPFTVRVTRRGIIIPGYDIWFLRFIKKLLENDEKILKLLLHNPFPEEPPLYLRARFYIYRFTNWEERKKSGAWWKRTLIDEYMPPVSISDINI